MHLLLVVADWVEARLKWSMLLPALENRGLTWIGETVQDELQMDWKPGDNWIIEKLEDQGTEGSADCRSGGRHGYCTGCRAGGSGSGAAWRAGGPVAVAGGAAAITRGYGRTARAAGHRRRSQTWWRLA